MTLPYDLFDKNSIIQFAQQLKNKTLKQACGASVSEHKLNGKGNFGQILEKYYFEYEPNSDAEPDFKEVGLELKSSPLKTLKNGEFRAKERLVLNVINYEKERNGTFETGSFWLKNADLLLVFYLHQVDSNVLDYVVHLVDEWNLKEQVEDLIVIRNDWAKIQEKINSGLAHELSEGDTFYLGACTKGGKGGNPRLQFGTKITAKQRAYSLKQGYVNHIIASIAKGSNATYGKLLQSKDDLVKHKTIDSLVIGKFKSYYGKTVEDLTRIFGVTLNVKAKNFHSRLSNLILGVELGKKIEEFEKAEIIIKTVRLKKNNLPEQDVSFPCFNYEELAAQKWGDSEFKEMLEHKFLFIFFQDTEVGLVLKKATFWNMPYEDIQEARKVWLQTKQLIRRGEIVKDVLPTKRLSHFPNKSSSEVSHVRPHAKDANDTFPLPKPDKLTGAAEYTKHCFWLNSQYVRDKIYQLA